MIGSFDCFIFKERRRRWRQKANDAKDGHDAGAGTGHISHKKKALQSRGGMWTPWGLRGVTLDVHHPRGAQTGCIQELARSIDMPLFLRP